MNDPTCGFPDKSKVLLVNRHIYLCLDLGLHGVTVSREEGFKLGNGVLGSVNLVHHCVGGAIRRHSSAWRRDYSVADLQDGHDSSCASFGLSAQQLKVIGRGVMRGANGIQRPGIKQGGPLAVYNLEDILLGPRSRVSRAVRPNVNEVSIAERNLDKSNRAGSIEDVCVGAVLVLLTCMWSTPHS